MLEQAVSNLISDDATLSRKQLAMRDRENELLLIACSIVEREGFAQLNMDKLAAASSYSKGTIYNHFNSKEDLFAALAIQALSKKIPLFTSALNFEGSSREKLIAMHAGMHLFSKLSPILAMCALVSRTPAVTEKSAPERLEKLNTLEDLVVSFGDKFIELGQSSGDIILAPGITSDSIVFANWAMAFGTSSLVNNATQSSCVSRQHDTNIVLQNLNFLLDGMRWMPLSCDFDYQKTWERAEKDLFGEEVALLENQS
ncbi:TetR/AcrR family transcriptional regulator [Enterovibrio makurazakiensis]|uniref:TetR/AcrR family transcriptional regulator n=1 Tax=Enterovibrio gelatinilyticus TaxID=2899819 RepID=A0ABT5R6H6_9GAMM|nr:TetR/AcrR family transcriptional regulator [Enterovibrio sp. ZSDZ42]MDD1795371.1 TetR/AcrR family transcriptional regulator [Enterovibrio sp. ZSDZ42]